MCSAFTLDFRYDNSTNIIFGDVYFTNTKCSSKLCLQKATLQSLGRSDYQCLQSATVCQVRNISFEDQTSSFYLSFGQGVYISEDSPKSTQDVIVELFCLGKHCYKGEKCQSPDGYVTTPRSIYGCGKC